MAKINCREVLDHSWNDFINCLGEYSESELKDLLGYESKHRKRKHFISRIHARYSKVRSAREREEILNGNGDDN